MRSKESKRFCGVCRCENKTKSKQNKCKRKCELLNNLVIS